MLPSIIEKILEQSKKFAKYRTEYIKASVSEQEHIFTQVTYHLTSMLTEELGEFVYASNRGNKLEMADALADLFISCISSFVLLKFPMDEIISEVSKSNESKLANAKINEHGKFVKSASFAKPDLRKILIKHKIINE